MLGKMIGALAGAKIADRMGGVSGPGGALLGAGAVSLARRIGPLGIAAAAAGGYAYKRYSERRTRNEGSPAGAQPSAT